MERKERHDSEIRQNKATNQWVIFAPSRRRRPHDFARPAEETAPLPAHDPNCPFCPGNEAKLTPVVWQLPAEAPPGWRTRVAPNKFAALAPSGTVARRQEGIYLAMDGYGRHEVIIEHPRHDRNMALMTEDEVGAVVETYHRRYLELMDRRRTMLTIIFRNHGRGAGASLIHPHSQLITLGMAPNHVRNREMEAQRYFDHLGKCVYCEILAFELKEGVRIVAENESFAAFAPFAAEVPFEIWIMPKRHMADFGLIADREKADLAGMLRIVTGRLYRRLNDPDYNYVVHSAARYRAREPQLHWYVQLQPRLTTRAGFEIGSGVSINPSLPEADAAFLRQAAETPEP